MPEDEHLTGFKESMELVKDVLIKQVTSRGRGVVNQRPHLSNDAHA